MTFKLVHLSHPLPQYPIPDDGRDHAPGTSGRCLASSTWLLTIILLNYYLSNCACEASGTLGRVDSLRASGVVWDVRFVFMRIRLSTLKCVKS
jgi:hypothetical protein